MSGKQLVSTTELRHNPLSLTQQLVLTTGDVDILRQVFQHRFLRREQLSTLVGRHEKRVHRRLLKLSGRSYLKILRFAQQKFIYCLGSAGVKALVEQGIASPNLLDFRPRTHELKELFLKHEMMIVDIHVVMSLASSDGPLKLIKWQEGKSLWDSVSVIDQGSSKTLPIRPDAFLTLEDTRRLEGKYAHFALEADRGTANPR